MTEAEIRKFEEELKSAPLTPLSGRFFEAVRARMAEEDVALSADDAEIEAALRALTPRAPSEAFFRRTAEALGESGNGGNTLDFPKRSRAFPRWISAAAAAGIAAAGVAFWQLSETEVPNYELVSTEKQRCEDETRFMEDTQLVTFEPKVINRYLEPSARLK